VNGENFPDGLVAAAFGHRILLTKADSLPVETAATIEALEDGCGVGTITVVGGEAAVSSDVYEDLDDLNGTDGIQRVAGADRYATAIAVAKAAAGGSGCPGNAILATGTDFPDALASGILIGALGGPIILNSGSALRADVKAYLTACAGTIYIVGGTAAVPASIDAELAGMGKLTKRIAGANRAETAAAIAVAAAGGGAFTPANLVLVNGNSFADALGAGVFALRAGAPMLLVNAGSIPPATAGLHVAACNSVSGVWAIGGTAVVSAAVLEGAVAATACEEPVITSATLTNSAVKQASCELNGNVSGMEGVVVSAVPGSVADGAAGNDWDIEVIDISDTQSNYVAADPVAQEMTIGIKVPAATAPAPFGLTQQQLVDAWIAIGGDATKYFVPSVTIKTGAPSGYIDGDDPDGGPDCEPANGSQTQTIVINFNIPVMDDANPAAGVVLQSNDFTGTAGFTVVSPLVATPGGAASYTLVAVNVTNAADLRVAGTDSVNVANGAVFSAATGIVADHTLADTKLS
jgi:putative cell wall-binding protein